jgi:hypothetical protein
MGRSRNIKPSLYDNEYLAQLEPHARLLFIGLWCLADKEGRLEDRPLRIHGQLFPYEGDLNIGELLGSLSESPERFITRYEVDGKRYIQINNFLKHQRPHVKEKESLIPTPRAEDVQSPEKAVQSPTINRPDPPDTGYLIPNSLISDCSQKKDELVSQKLNSKSSKQKTSPPDSLPITEPMLVWAKDKNHVTDVQWLERETEKCLNHFRAKGEKRADWVATWRNWIIRALEYQKPKQSNAPVSIMDDPALINQLKRVGA